MVPELQALATQINFVFSCTRACGFSVWRHLDSVLWDSLSLCCRRRAQGALFGGRDLEVGMGFETIDEFGGSLGDAPR